MRPSIKLIRINFLQVLYSLHLFQNIDAHRGTFTDDRVPHGPLCVGYVIAYKTYGLVR